MKNRLLQIIPAVIALLGIAFAPISYWCMYSGGSCYNTWVSHVYPYFTNPFYNFSLYFFSITIVLIFVSRQIFNSWLKLAKWTVPLSVIFIAATPVSHMGISLDLFPFYRDDAARLAGEVFAAASLILIIWKSLSLRRVKS